MIKAIKKISVVFGSIILIVLSAYSTSKQAVFPEQISWRTHFLASPDEHSPFYALTATRWQYSYNASIRGNDLHINFKFIAGVDPSQSWVKLNRLKGAESKQKLLNHEQGHVNINFLLLKDGEQKVRFRNYTVKNYKKLIQENANKVSAYYQKMQKQYDEETKHGADDVQQKRWDGLIEEQLKKFIKVSLP